MELALATLSFAGLVLAVLVVVAVLTGAGRYRRSSNSAAESRTEQQGRRRSNRGGQATSVIGPPEGRRASAMVTGRDSSLSVRYFTSSGVSDGRLEIPSTARWIPMGEGVTIAGQHIPGGMLYVGSGLQAIAPYSGIEPALVNPGLPVRLGRVSATGEGMSYWPSYSEILPEHRAGYIQWLASGRNAPDAYIGYVFLYFYGLERRAFCDPTAEDDPNGFDCIVSEVERLRHVYGKNNSFAGYSANFLNFCRFRSGEVVGSLRTRLFSM